MWLQFSAYRCDSAGTQNPQGSYIRMVGTSIISSINDTNFKTTSLRYREKGTTEWTTGVLDTTSYNPSLSVVVPADVNKQYEAQIYLFDFYGEAQSIINIGTAFVLMDFNASGKGVAFGKVSELDAFEVDIDFLYKGVLIENKIITEYGSNANGHYVRYC